MSRFLLPRFSSLSPYVPGEQPRDRTYIKLNTNESPYPPSPEVLACLGREDLADLRLYSDPEGIALRSALAERYGLRPENVFLSNGSDDILNFAFLAYAADGKKAYYPDITYGFYPVFAALHGTRPTVVPLREDFTVPAEAFCENDGLVVLANPNAPTGLALSPAEIETILKANPDQVVLVDEAYVDFGADTCLPLLSRYPNLLIARTFSKSRSLAGARLGFALAGAGLIDDLNRIKYATNPYNINRLTLKIGEAAVRSDAYFEENCRRIARTRDETAASLRDMGFSVLPSLSNFLFARHKAFPGDALYRRLKERGI